MNRGIVIDTNILVSALLTPGGTASRVLHTVENGEFVIYYSSRILLEYQDVLSRPKFKIDEVKANEFLRNFTMSGIAVSPEPSQAPLPDENDRTFYDTAKSVGALLITGNTKHFPSEPFIITAAEFLEQYT